MKNLGLVLTSLALFTGCVVGSELVVEGETDEAPEMGSEDDSGTAESEVGQLEAARYLCGNTGGVVIWERPYFQGRTAVLCYGSYHNLESETANLGWFENWNDRIGSLQLFGNLGATLYRDSVWRNQVDQLGRNGSRLETATGITGIAMYPTTATSDRHNWGCAYGGVVIFENENWTGRATVLCGGQYQLTNVALGNSSWNDRINGMITFGGRRATIYQHYDFTGQSYTAGSNTTVNMPNCGLPFACRVYGSPLPGDDVSSIKVHY
jgi:hypothetical protein